MPDSNSLLSIFTSVCDLHLPPDISKLGHPNSCHSQPALPVDFLISAIEDSVLRQFLSHRCFFVFFCFFTLSLTAYPVCPVILLTLPSKQNQHSAIPPPFLMISSSPCCHQLSWIIAVAQWLLIEGYFPSPKEDMCQWTEIFLLSWLQKGCLQLALGRDSRSAGKYRTMHGTCPTQHRSIQSEMSIALHCS